MHTTYLSRFFRVRTDRQETGPTVPGIKVYQRYFLSVHVEFCNGGIRLPGSTVDLTGADSLAALGFANRFESRRMALKLRVIPDPDRRSGSCPRFCAIDRCRPEESECAVTTAETPARSKSNERRMRKSAGEKRLGIRGRVQTTWLLLAAL
jgi:hypothetical protein